LETHGIRPDHSRDIPTNDYVASQPYCKIGDKKLHADYSTFHFWTLIRVDTLKYHAKGFWRNPETTADTIKNGWLHTGDMGYMDESVYLFIMDRSKNMIISGDENIYPREIEKGVKSAFDSCS